ncbi:site-specific integrase [Rhodobacteraceae bacterium D3-12]|nr:site-specific integrase [Rhodobacteraceae bacterium D3-12]
MARSYKGVFVKSHRVYTVEDIKTLFKVNNNTVSNWVGEGLTTSDGKRPHVFRGSMIKHFHAQRTARSKIDLRPGEFKCTGCKAAVFPDIAKVQDVWTKPKKLMYRAVCPDCEAVVCKLPSAADCDIIEDCRNPNTTRQRLYEEKDQKPGGIGINKSVALPNAFLENDRIIARWQTFAGRFDEKTVDAYLATLRYCEEVTEGKRFDRFTVADAAKLRDDLKRRVRKDAEDPLSTSTVKHRASHLKSFFEWLLKQREGARLAKDLPDYLELPKAAFAQALPKDVKDFPKIDEAEEMLRAMPSKSLVDQRARAIFAIAFLGALRADTVISLQIKHVDVAGRRIVQDGAAVRSKNGKSEHIFWFPIPTSFEEEVIGWIGTLKARGFCEDDALFPSSDWLEAPRKLMNRGEQPVPVMATKHAVSASFAVASKHCSTKYSPHSAKHTIGALRDQKRMTHEQRRAWSENMGHESERTTEIHYAKFSDEQRLEVLESIGNGEEEHASDLSDEEKVAMFNKFLALCRRL